MEAHADYICSGDSESGEEAAFQCKHAPNIKGGPPFIVVLIHCGSLWTHCGFRVSTKVSTDQFM